MVRAWDFKDENKTLLVAPAMNTLMWENPITEKHISVLKEFCTVIPTVEKTLMCGDTGKTFWVHILQKERRKKK